jgi:hypothetical protein
MIRGTVPMDRVGGRSRHSRGPWQVVDTPTRLESASRSTEDEAMRRHVNRNYDCTTQLLWGKRFTRRWHAPAARYTWEPEHLFRHLPATRLRCLITDARVRKLPKSVQYNQLAMSDKKDSVKWIRIRGKGLRDSPCFSVAVQQLSLTR